MKKKDKRITLNQCIREIEKALDDFEEIAKITLHDEFRFGDKRQQRFLENFRQNAFIYLSKKEKDLRRLLR